ncbi:thymidylate synthase complementing protein ThyX [Calothrix parasitica NIES-267]|uniref:FAD-dependent thymidylate synthase n=1 Tax=Calothrix parasitica NIES-267 TaxID=1973488 RepID=A0A1Z4LHS4_9CYAN|nr:thymidylate synthase complementing protein ThyX [Calothrix parasitica NIES-267]
MNRFRVEVITKTPNPQQVIYAAMHQDYTDKFVYDERDEFPSESQCGEIIVKRLLAGERGHYGPLEHPQIVFNCGYFPHSVMQQARTHRISVSFDVQSFRYTSEQFIKVAEGEKDVEDVFYLRPVDYYTNRKGKKYYYSPEQRQTDLNWCMEAVKRYKIDFDNGISEEHIRGKMPFDYRQHFIVSLNLRSLMHFLDMRNKKDAQLEIQKLCELMLIHFENWVPAIAEWYKSHRLAKARLAP